MKLSGGDQDDITLRLASFNPLLHTDDIGHMPLNVTFENEQFHLLLQFFKLFINVNISVFWIVEIVCLMIVKQTTF